MKNALCLFGMPRVFEENYDALKKSFPDFDVFAHFWSVDEDTRRKDWVERLGAKSVFVQEVVDTRYHAYNGVTHSKDVCLNSQIKIEGLESFERDLKSPGWSVNPRNIVSMWNSMSKSVSLALSHSSTNRFEYDRIVLVRTDIVPEDKFDVTKTFIGDVHQFLMPSYHPGSRISFWLPDHIISMTPNAARILTFLPQFSYHYYYAQEVPAIPEIMLGYHMVCQGMKVSSSGLYYRDAYKFWGDDGRI